MDNLEMLIDNEMNNGELILTVNEMTRELEYNGNLVIGVEGDYKADRVYFISPKIVGDNIDVSASTVQIYIDYKNALNESYITQSTDKAVQTDGTVKFSWVLGANVAAKKGQVKFRVCFKNINTSGELTNEWHTTYTTGEILEGIDVSEKTPEVITDETTTAAYVLSELDRMETVFNNVTGYTKEEIQGIEINGVALGSDLKAEISAEDIKLRAGEDIDVYSKLNNIDYSINEIKNNYAGKMTQLGYISMNTAAGISSSVPLTGCTTDHSLLIVALKCKHATNGTLHTVSSVIPLAFTTFQQYFSSGVITYPNGTDTLKFYIPSTSSVVVTGGSSQYITEGIYVFGIK